MKNLLNFLKKSSFSPILFLLFYFLTPYFLILVFDIIFISAFITYIFIFLILILISECVFNIIYKQINSQSYSKIDKIPFKKITVKPHPNLPFVHKKNFKSQVKSHKLNFPLHKEIFSAPELETNNFGYCNGLKGNREIVVPKENIFRINCLGASTTQYYLEDENGVHSYPLELEKILKEKFPNKNLEVNNCGTGGYVSSDLLVRFLLQILETDPDIVIFYHGYNDIRSYLTNNFTEDYSHSRKNLGENYHKFYLGSLTPYVPLNFVNYLQSKWFPQNHRYSLIESISHGKFDFENQKNLKKGLDSYKRNIQNLITTCKARKIKIILCSFCFYLHRFVKDEKLHNIYKEIVDKENTIIKELANLNNVEYIDINKLIDKNDKNFVDTIHFTPDGMKKFAFEVSKFIKL